MKISPVMREYLGEIYRLERSAAGVTTSALAERLEVSPSAAARMLRRLDEAGLLTHLPYQDVKLSPQGEREALRSIRRHRLLEAFLVKVMGFGWDEVHEQAHPLELAISGEFEDRMDAVAGYPTHCPHGDPIPTKDGRMAEMNDQPLLDAPVGSQVVIRRVKTHDGEKLRYLAQLGLVPGAPIQLVNRSPFNGPLRLKIGRQEHVIGAELAQALRVEVTP
ncbi:MAG TPA: metal-dependent transcriptional regulator [Anaerolineales bacterium]|nr:metal-dependent transcriptional regulator [Anaerolineales bacterium]